MQRERVVEASESFIESESEVSSFFRNFFRASAGVRSKFLVAESVNSDSEEV